jgi:TPR repeat protein
VVPVLVGGAVMPRADALPPDIAGLAYRNALEVDDARFESSMDTLTGALERILLAPLLERTFSASRAQTTESPVSLAPPDSPRPVRGEVASARGTSPRIIALGGLLLAVAGAFAWYFTGGRALPPGPSTAPGVNASSSGGLAGAEDFAKAEDLYFGRSGVRDYRGAAGLYQKAADLGNASAQNSLGRMYELGEGLPRDDALALQWYRKAAAQGHPDAQAALQRLARPSAPVQQRPPADPAPKPPPSKQ